MEFSFVILLPSHVLPFHSGGRTSGICIKQDPGFIARSTNLNKAVSLLSLNSFTTILCLYLSVPLSHYYYVSPSLNLCVFLLTLFTIFAQLLTKRWTPITNWVYVCVMVTES